MKATFSGLLANDALSRGDSIAFYPATSLAPVLLVVVSIAGPGVGRMPLVPRSLRNSPVAGPAGGEFIESPVRGTGRVDFPKHGRVAGNLHPVVRSNSRDAPNAMSYWRHLAVVHRRQIADWIVPRLRSTDLGPRCGGRADRPYVPDVLLRADLPLLCRTDKGDR
jgi:hypothetical protein